MPNFDFMDSNFSQRFYRACPKLILLLLLGSLAGCDPFDTGPSQDEVVKVLSSKPIPSDLGPDQLISVEEITFGTPSAASGNDIPAGTNVYPIRVKYIGNFGGGRSNHRALHEMDFWKNAFGEWQYEVKPGVFPGEGVTYGP